MSNHKIGVIASGRGSNLQAIMDKVAAGVLPLEIAVVVSDKSDAFALERSKRAGIPSFVVERGQCAGKRAFEEKLDGILRAHGVELVVLAGFMRILGPDFIARWPQRVINIHPALLPSFPGLDAQGQALRYGAKITGCTVHFVDEGMDTGPIILQKAVPVEASDDEETLSARILREEHKALPEALALWAAGKLSVQGRKVVIEN